MWMISAYTTYSGYTWKNLESVPNHVFIELYSDMSKLLIKTLFLWFLLENDAPNMNRVLVCDHKLHVNHLGMKSMKYEGKQASQ